MLKLIYHTAVFGPIHLEYDRPVIRVGRSEDNDLVLRHPSVEPHHCLLVFRDEKVLCVPPGQAISSETDLQSLAGPEFGVGDQLRIGELRFSLAHSARTVAIPEVRRQGQSPEAAEGASAPGEGGGASQRGFFCEHYREFIPHGAVRRVGLVGHAKRSLCPKCSRPVEGELEYPAAASGREAHRRE